MRGLFSNRKIARFGFAVLATGLGAGFATSAGAGLDNLRTDPCGWNSGPYHLLQVKQAIGSPSVCDIDNDVFAVMKANNTRGAALAIVVGTRLVYAKGYTLGPAGTPLVKPTTYFRQASVSKLFTALAVVQLLQENKLALTDSVRDRLAPGYARDAKFQDPIHNVHFITPFDKVTIADLLNMDGGLPELFGGAPLDPQIAQAVGGQLPLTRDDVIHYLAKQPGIVPGVPANAAYSNTDYALLGYIVAKARGKDSLIDAIQNTLLTPLAITRVRDARALIGDQMTDEATYAPLNPAATVQSVMSPDQPIVEKGYGETNFTVTEGSGGLSAAATDVARLLAALSFNGIPQHDGKKIANWAAIAKQELAGANSSFHDGTYPATSYGYYGLDAIGPWLGKTKVPPYQGYKGGLLSTSQNAIFFQSGGGISYVICWSGLVPAGESFYPVFKSVGIAAATHDWGNADHFPEYDMPSFPTPLILKPLNNFPPGQ